MQRRDAVRLFREICECIPDPSVLSCVFLIQRSKPASLGKENFELWINAAFDNPSLRDVQSIVKERKLVLEEKRRFFVIYEAAPKEPEMEIYA